jgi:hypothetical protein
VDLRGRPIPDFIVNKPLVSLDLAGAGTGAVCGGFTQHGAKVTFTVIMMPGMAAGAQPIADKLHAADDQDEKGTR